MSENPVPVEQGGTIDFSKTKVIGLGGGIKDINADAAIHQFLTVITPSIRIVDAGAGLHTFGFYADGYTTATIPASPPAPPTTIVPGVETTILSLNTPNDGVFVFTGNLTLACVWPVTARMRLRVNGSDVCEVTQNFTPSLNIQNAAFGAISYAINIAGAALITMDVTQDSLGPLTFLGATLNALRFGATP